MPASRRGSPGRQVAGVAALAAGGLATGLLLGELVVRAVAPQPALIQSRHTYIRDSVLGYRLRPGHDGVLANRVEYRTSVRINPWGWRGPASEGPPSGRTRILFLGDSFVFGQGVEAHEAVAARLEALLTDGGDSVEVINAGVPGYGTVQAVLWLEQYGRALAPDLVILGAFLGNDIQDNARDPADRWQITGHGGDAAPAWYRPVTDWLYAHSHLYGLLRVVPGAVRASLSGPTMHPDVLAAIERYGTSHDRNLAGVRATDESFERLKAMAAAHNFDAVLVLVPEALQVESWRQQVLAGRLPPDEPVDLRWPNARLDSLARRHRIPVLDLTDPLRVRTARGEELYYPVDGHWTTAAHVVAARLIAEWLEAGGPPLRPRS